MFTRDIRAGGDFQRGRSIAHAQRRVLDRHCTRRCHHEAPSLHTLTHCQIQNRLNLIHQNHLYHHHLPHLPIQRSGSPSAHTVHLYPLHRSSMAYIRPLSGLVASDSQAPPRAGAPLSFRSMAVSRLNQMRRSLSRSSTSHDSKSTQPKSRHGHA
jgi:hypothetical protein